MGVSDGNSCGRVIQAYRAADIALEGCWSYMPRKCRCLEDALSMAHEAMVHGRHASFEGLGMHDGVKHRCLDGNQTLTSRTAQETARKKRRLNVGPVWVAQVWEQAGRKGAFTMAHMCTACHFLPTEDFVWFLARNNSYRGTVRKSSGANIHCAFSGCQSKAEDNFCVVSHAVW